MQTQLGRQLQQLEQEKRLAMSQAQQLESSLQDLKVQLRSTSVAAEEGQKLREQIGQVELELHRAGKLAENLEKQRTQAHQQIQALQQEMNQLAAVKDTELAELARIRQCLEAQKQQLEAQAKGLQDDLEQAKSRANLLSVLEKQDEEQRWVKQQVDLVGMEAFYDLVIRIHRFRDVVTAGKGWEVIGKCGADSTLRWKGPIATVLGDFNKGKTFVLNLIGSDPSKPLPSSAFIHTEGLSFKQVVLNLKKVVFLDTAGFNAPSKGITDEILREAKSTEEFLREVSFHIADFFICVVGSITGKEQIDLHGLCHDLKTSGKGGNHKLIIVIHNLRDCTNEEDWELHWENLCQIYSDCDQQKLTVEVNGQQEEIKYLEGKATEQNQYLEFQRHYLLGRHGTPGGKFNDAVIQLIRQTIVLHHVQVQEFDMRERILNACNSAIGNHLEPVPNIRFDSAQGKVLLRGEVPETHRNNGGKADPSTTCDDARPMCTLRKRSQLTYLANGMDSGNALSYDVLLFKGPRKLQVQVEIPGLVLPSGVQLTEILSPQFAPSSHNAEWRFSLTASKEPIPNCEVVRRFQRRFGPLDFSVAIPMEFALVDPESLKYENGVVTCDFMPIHATPNPFERKR
eukprot:TRINITY_DN14733_c0_g1_i2.p1 TRINITY_DN14733_c0_g1~~TRINITY_DN14733_c0_g1_i2.p1  ORF type:complete len:626 (+),score=178.98 TRINITY_DN14733_c0_g1_i2:455-2332(+)